MSKAASKRKNTGWMAILCGVLAGFFLLISVSCSNDGNEDSSVKENMSRQTDSREAAPGTPVEVSPPAEYVEYIKSHTAGIISSRSDVVVTFLGDVKELTPNQAKQAVVCTPRIAGIFRMEDGNTLRIHPSEPLPSGQSYTVDIELGEFLEGVPEERRSFSFGFSVIKQEIEVIFDQVVIESPDADIQSITGRIQTADYAANDRIEEMLSFSGDHKAVKWEHMDSQNLHRFVITGVPRKKRSVTEHIEWVGKPLGVDDKGKVAVEIPESGDFSFLSYKMPERTGEAIVLSFSMPLDPDQDITGLVRVSEEENTRVVIESNRMLLYPRTRGGAEVFLSSSIRDVSGQTLGGDESFTLPSAFSKPHAQILSIGGILPNANGLTIPIEAVSLKALDIEVIRIFEDNLIQFLQVNQDIRGVKEIKRVGRPVAAKTVSLEGKGLNLYDKNLFHLDISDIIDAEPGALYQIRATYRRSQSLYPCEDEHNEEDDLPFGRGDWDSPDRNTMWDYYGNGYSWRDRDNPCSNSYYMRRSTQTNVLASDIGLIAKSSDVGGVTVYASNLITTEPLSGVTVEVCNYQQQVLGTEQTNAQGYAFISSDTKPFAVIAKKDGMVSMIRVDDGSSLSMSDFDIAGMKSTRGIKGFIYADRGVWRPGDDIYLNFILEDAHGLMPKDLPVIMELTDPQNRTVRRLVNRDPVGNIYSFTTSTDPEAPTGNWKAAVLAGGERFEKQVKIETVKPNRLKINLEFDEPYLTADTARTLEGVLSATWLHGALARNMKSDIELQLLPMYTTFDGYSAYTFEDPTKRYSSSPREIFSGQLDNEGKAVVSFSPPKTKESSGFLRMEFQTKVYEEGGNFSFSKDTIPYYPYEQYVGINLPSGDAKRGMLLTDEDHPLDIVLLDERGEAVQSGEVHVEMYKMSWKWWWDKSSENLANFMSRSHSRRLFSDDVEIREGKGQWMFQIKYPDWGRYMIRVNDPESGHSAAKIVYIDWPGWAGTPQRGDSGATMLSFYAEKSEYTAGETAKVTIPTAPGGRILLSLENSSKVINSWWAETRENSTSVTFPVTAEMAPTTYITATYVQPFGSSGNDLPIRMYGTVPVSVVDPATKLKPLLKMDDVLAPEETVTFSITEEEGREMAYTVAVVDEGLLDISNYTTPDPWSTFFSKEALGVRTWDIYDDIISASSADFGTLLAFGGGRGEEPTPPKKANRFKPVVKFFGPFFLEAGETDTHSFQMPLYVGSVKTMVVASDQGRYGNTDKTTPVKNDLMVLGTLPRVLGPGEKIRIPVNVFSMKEGPQEVTVSLKTTPLISIAGETVKKISFSGQSDTFVYFDAIVAEALGPAKVVFTAAAPGIETSDEIEIEVRAPNPPVTLIHDMYLKPGESGAVDVTEFGLEGTFSRVLEASSLPPVNLEKRLDFLIRYPHGCIEQTTSSVFPQLYLGQVTNLTAGRLSAIQENINNGIKRIGLFQTAEGGFSYWPGNPQANDWGTNYAGHFLIEASRSGYRVPRELMTRWQNYQKERAERFGSSDSNTHIQAYRLFTMALNGSPSMGAMNRLRERDSLAPSSRWHLAGAYVLAGRDDAARELVDGLAALPDSYSPEPGTYGSRERDIAIKIMTLTRLGREKDAFRAIETLSEVLSSDTWLSTQTTAYSLMAISTYIMTHGGEPVTDFTWSMGDTSAAVNTSSHFYRLDLPDGNGSFSARNRSDMPQYLKVVEKGIPLKGRETDSSRNLSLDIQYRRTTGNGDFRVDSLVSGTNFSAEITVKNLTGSTINDLALSQIVPSGWEIINHRLTGQSFDSGDSFEYQDIRDDRVYTYFSLGPNREKTFKVLLNAAYQGTFYMPSIVCEAMYDNTYFAQKAGQIVEVRGE